MQVVRSAARQVAMVTALTALVMAGPAPRPSGPPVITMGLNDSRSGTIGRLGEVDVYEVTIARPGVFRFIVRNIPREIAYGAEIAELHMTMAGPNDFRWSKFTTGHKRSFQSEPFALPTGTYRIKIKDYFGDNASAENYIIQTVFTEVKDPNEPNDASATATVLRNNRPVRGWILPAKDVDYYKIHLTTPGRVSITITGIPKEIREGRGVKALYLGLRDQNDRVLREYPSSPGQDTLKTGEMVMNVGTYVLCVRDFNKDNYSASPYTITARFPSPTGKLSPNERDLLAAVRVLFEKSGGIDEEERKVLKRLDARFMEDN